MRRCLRRCDQRAPAHRWQAEGLLLRKHHYHWKREAQASRRQPWFFSGSIRPTWRVRARVAALGVTLHVIDGPAASHAAPPRQALPTPHACWHLLESDARSSLHDSPPKFVPLASHLPFTPSLQPSAKLRIVVLLPSCFVSDSGQCMRPWRAKTAASTPYPDTV